MRLPLAVMACLFLLVDNGLAQGGADRRLLARERAEDRVRGADEVGEVAIVDRELSAHQPEVVDHPPQAQPSLGERPIERAADQAALVFRTASLRLAQVHERAGGSRSRRA